MVINFCLKYFFLNPLLYDQDKAHTNLIMIGPLVFTLEHCSDDKQTYFLKPLRDLADLKTDLSEKTFIDFLTQKTTFIYYLHMGNEQF